MTFLCVYKFRHVPPRRRPDFVDGSPEGGIEVTENGAAVNEPTVDLAVDDKARIVYFEGYLKEMHSAIQLGADVRAVSCVQTASHLLAGLLHVPQTRVH